jgi:chlorobactene glucosyltransferase
VTPAVSLIVTSLVVAIVAVHLAISVNLLVNILTAPRLAGYRGGSRQPRVSVLTPARNEASVIESSVAALLAQRYPDLEVLVLDDASTDATAAIVARLAGTDPRLRLLTGQPLPAGWLGKHFACQQLADAASGEILLFIDADTTLCPDAVTCLVAALDTAQADLVTALPRQLVGSWGERLVVPLVYASIWLLLPLPLVPRRPEPSLATGIGQVMAFRADAYRRLGGHAAVRDRVLDDVELARRVKQQGGRLLVVDAGDLATCRMYRSWVEVWHGFSKNLYAFFNHAPWALAGGIVIGLTLWVAPFVGLPLALLLGAPPLLAGLLALAVGLVLAQRLIIAVRCHFPRGDVLLHPFAMLALLAIALNSAWRCHRGDTHWKGRIVPPAR